MLIRYFDLFLKDNMDRIIFLNQINNVLPEGIKVLDARQVPEDVKSLQAIINTAVYTLKMQFKNKINKKEEKQIINNFINKEQIIITRFRRNKDDREINLKPMIYDAQLKKSGEWQFTVDTGSSGNVRPSEINRALIERYQEIKKIPVTNIIREKMLVRINENFYLPFAKKVIRGGEK